MTKKLDNDAAVQVAEEAFRAGFKAGWDMGIGSTYILAGEGFEKSQENRAWDNFEPSEDIKELVNG